MFSSLTKALVLFLLDHQCRIFPHAYSVKRKALSPKVHQARLLELIAAILDNAGNSARRVSEASQKQRIRS